MQLGSLHLRRDAGVEMIIAVDSTRRGPALGGCRWQPYGSSAAARREACALAAAMTRKAAVARLALGGGKAVVIGDTRDRTADQLRAFGAFVESLGGRYITAADMGTGEEEMSLIAETTSQVVGVARRLGGCGDPSPYTALGVCLAMEAALRHRDAGLEGSRVAVQGVGHVGRELIALLLAAGAHVLAGDLSPGALEGLPPQVERVSAAAILEADCDVLAPCGPPDAIDARLAERLACRIVCGAANNPLSHPTVAAALDARGILYVPDFVANAGGLIHLAVARERGDEAATRERLAVIPENVDRVLERAKMERVDPAIAAERLALAAIAAPDDAPDLG